LRVRRRLKRVVVLGMKQCFKRLWHIATMV